jgi:hypothetical protein
VKRCVVVTQQPVLQAKPSHILTQSPWNVTIVCEIDSLACQDEFFINTPTDVKENDEHSLHFTLHLSRLFCSRWVWTFRIRLVLSSPNASLITVRVSVAFFPWFAQNLMLFPCRIKREIASGQIHDSNLYTDSQDMLVYKLLCITVLQLLYRWQHQSRKLLIPTRPPCVLTVHTGKDIR